MTDGNDERHEDLQTGLIEGREAWRQAVTALMAQAVRRQARRLVMLDEDFADWPLGAPDVVDMLTRWVASHRELVVIAADFDQIARRHPRWVAWRRTWGHAVQCLALHEDDRAEVPGLFLVEGIAVAQLSDRRHGRGSLRDDAAALAQAVERLAHLQQRGSPDFPVTVLGL
jgi:hypothetical protein